jgi:succinate dehydrogenase / fumarate reductase cytochrome b subunit
MKRQRPLSPHLQVYRPQITSVLSILHRATGIGLCGGLVVFSLWLIAAASAPNLFAVIQHIFGSGLGMVLLLGWSWCLFYHLCAGIRHLVWDTGRGLDLPSVTISGWVVVSVSTILALAAWFAGKIMP